MYSWHSMFTKLKKCRNWFSVNKQNLLYTIFCESTVKLTEFSAPFLLELLGLHSLVTASSNDRWISNPFKKYIFIITGLQQSTQLVARKNNQNVHSSHQQMAWNLALAHLLRVPHSLSLPREILFIDLSGLLKTNIFRLRDCLKFTACWYNEIVLHNRVSFAALVSTLGHHLLYW